MHIKLILRLFNVHKDDKVQKNNKKVLTKRALYAILMKLSTREEERKNLKKVLEKYLTRVKSCGIMFESPQKSGDNGQRNR